MHIINIVHHSVPLKALHLSLLETFDCSLRYNETITSGCVVEISLTIRCEFLPTQEELSLNGIHNMRSVNDSYASHTKMLGYITTLIRKDIFLKLL